MLATYYIVIYIKEYNKFQGLIYIQRRTTGYICISYVTSVMYVAGINNEARGCAAPEGRVIYSGNVPNRGRDISNLCLHESVAMVNGTKFLVLSP